MRYTELEEFCGPKVLEQNDVVVFPIKGKKYEYVVKHDGGRGSYMNGEDIGNDAPFNELGVDKTAFFREMFGYDTPGGTWPETKGKSEKAEFTNFVYKILKLLKEKEIYVFTDSSLGQLKVGDIIEATKEASAQYGITVYGSGEWTVKKTMPYGKIEIQKGTGSCFDVESKYFRKVGGTPIDKDTQVNKMELKDVKKANLAEAKKQFNEEKTNAEIVFAKAELKRAQDQIDAYDREIKRMEEAKKPFLEILDKFK